MTVRATALLLAAFLIGLWIGVRLPGEDPGVSVVLGSGARDGEATHPAAAPGADAANRHEGTIPDSGTRITAAPRTQGGELRAAHFPVGDIGPPMDPDTPEPSLAASEPRHLGEDLDPDAY